jgi:hypothetical protein
LVSILTLTPAAIAELVERRVALVSDKAKTQLTSWFRKIITRAGFLRNGHFMARDEFRRLGFLGSGGAARLRNRLWAAVAGSVVGIRDEEKLRERADLTRGRVARTLVPVRGRT